MTKEQLISNMTSRQAVFMMYNAAAIKMQRIFDGDIDGFAKAYNDAGSRVSEMLAFDQIAHPEMNGTTLICMVEAFCNLAGRSMEKASAERGEAIPEDHQRMTAFGKDLLECIFCGYMNKDEMDGYSNHGVEQDLTNDECTALVQVKLREILVLMGRCKK
jgi:hypothetical protein